MKKLSAVGLAGLLFLSTAVLPVMGMRPAIRLEVLGTYATGVFDGGAAEIAAYDPASFRVYVVNADISGIDVLSIADPSNPVKLFTIDISPFGDQANSVAVRNGIVAAAVQADVKTDNGSVVFFDADGNFLKEVGAGALPDMVTFSPNGDYVLVANEGEPNDDYSIDPEGSVTVIDIRKGVANASAATAGFSGVPLAGPVRIYGPGASVEQDLEPEYIAVSHNSRTAWVTLQENNAVGVLDLKSASFTAVVSLGFKDYTAPGNALDPSDRDSAVNGGINIASWPVFGMYQPDSIATVKYKDDTYLITANEGDAREYGTFEEEARINSLTLDPTAFPNAAMLQMNSNLGRLNVTNTLGDVDNDGDYDALYTLGGRSFSVWTAGGELVWDSGDDIEQITAMMFPANFNANNDENDFDGRSDNKGPEPEGLAVGKAYGRNYAFIGLERIGGILVYDVTEPMAPVFVQYINNRDFSADIESPAAGDLGPEGLLFISDEESPTGIPLLVVANEISGTTTVYGIVKTR